MNISASQISSGCESGWTLYLDQSSYHSEDELQRDNYKNNNNNSISECGGKQEEEEEEEDLSMVSDASSGPPHYHDDCFCENGSSFSASNRAYTNKSVKKDKQKKKMMMMKEKCRNEYHSCLDDTASSPVSKKKSTVSRSEAFMDNRLDYSQGFSATHFNGESALGKQFGMFQSSLAKGSASKKPGDFQGGNWK